MMYGIGPDNHVLSRQRLAMLRERKPELARQIQIYALYLYKGFKFGAPELKALGVDRESQLEIIREDIDKLLREPEEEPQTGLSEETHRGG